MRRTATIGLPICRNLRADRTETGERQMMVYLPGCKLLYTSDLFAPDEKDTSFTPEYLLELRNAVAREHLDVETILGMHYDPTPYKTAMAALDTFLKSRPQPAAADAARPVLADELQPFASFRGSWSCHGRFPGNGRAIASTERFVPELLGHWLTMRHLDRPPFGYQAVEMWRYDAARKRFDNYVFDNASGIRHYTSPGWDGARLTWTLDSNAKQSDRFVFEREGAGHFQFDYSRPAGTGNWVIVDTLQCDQ